jgi:DNA-binding ferritin-like protein
MVDSKHSVWVDPLAFDAAENGPPYLPERSKTASNGMEVLDKIVPLFDGAPMAVLGAMVAVLRAASIVHQSHHWQSKGSNFYGDHLLYERIYGESLGFIDQVAERAVGSGSEDLVCPKRHALIVNGLVEFWCIDPTDPVRISLTIERCVVDCLATARKYLEMNGQLSDGTDNLLQGVSDKHEEFIYLLQQRGSVRLASGYDFRGK